MSQSIQDLQSQILNEIHGISTQTLNTLIAHWVEMFEDEVAKNHISRLTDHLSEFYADVIEETKIRKQKILSDTKLLHEEAIELKRLLQVDVSLSPKKGVPLNVYFLSLDNNLNILREQLKARRDEICQLLIEQETLCDELGEMPRELVDDPLPSEESLEDFRHYLLSLKAEKVNRLNEIAFLRNKTKQLLIELELPIVNEEDDLLLNDRYMLPSNTNLLRLRNMYEALKEQLEELQNSIEGLHKKLSDLWTCLEVGDSDRDKFTKLKDYSQKTYDLLRAEVDRCETLKRENLKKFIDKIRIDIQDWWGKTLKSDIEISRFSNFHSKYYTEDMLTLHEMELDDLKKFYYRNEKIFLLIQERQVLWERMSALEAKSQEPGRYNNRGGQLLKEEKERKTIASKLPKIELELINICDEYELNNNKKFTMYGKFVEDIIEMDWEKKRSDKEILMSTRKALKENNTPGTSHKLPNRTPMSSKTLINSTKKFATPNITTLSAMKRKLPMPDAVHAKRSLLSDLSSPNSTNELKVVRKTPFKSPMRKRIIATTIKSGYKRRSNNLKRRSGRRNNNIDGTSNGSNASTKLINKRKTRDSLLTSDSVTYDCFEEFLGTRSPCRSSIVTPHNITKSKKRNSIKKNREINGTPRTPHLLRSTRTITGATTSTSSVNTLHPDIYLRKNMKSPMLSRTRTPSPGQSKKLTTKNLPIII